MGRAFSHVEAMVEDADPDPRSRRRLTRAKIERRYALTKGLCINVAT